MSKNEDGAKRRRSNKHLIRFLVSCCLFLFVLCGCMLAALVLIGKHYVENSKQSANNSPEIPQPEFLISRLPNDTIPHHYDLTLLPNIEAGSFIGKVKITIELLDARDALMLHSQNLTIREVRLESANDTDEDDIEISGTEAKKIDVLIINLHKPIPPNFYYLYIEFSGTLLDHIWGFYRSRYFDEISNETR